MILGDKVYLGRYGVLQLDLFDFHEAQGDAWKIEPVATVQFNLPQAIHENPHGGWLDRSTAGSPLVHEGLMYVVDIYGFLYVLDLETKETVYFRDLGIDGLMHYNAVPVAASPTLIGNHVVVLDNQGTALVLATGASFAWSPATASKPSSSGPGQSRPRRRWLTLRRSPTAIASTCAASATFIASVLQSDVARAAPNQESLMSISVAESGAFVETFTLAPTGSGPLEGLSFAVKDIIDVGGYRTGCGNPTWLATHPPAVVHAVCVEQLLAAGGRGSAKL